MGSQRVGHNEQLNRTDIVEIKLKKKKGKNQLDNIQITLSSNEACCCSAWFARQDMAPFPSFPLQQIHVERDKDIRTQSDITMTTVRHRLLLAAEEGGNSL